jgi:soluble lytic murein transglycosylase
MWKMRQKHTHTLFLPLIAVVMALSAATISCTLSGDNVIEVSATPPDPNAVNQPPTPTPNAEGVIYLVATSEATATPLPVEIPPLPPEDGITAAGQALFNGNYAVAVAYYQDILGDSKAAGDLRASAAYGLGEAALRERLFQDSIDALSNFIGNYPDDARIPQAYFLRGDANLGAYYWQAAISDFEMYLRLRPGIIDSYAYERIGDAYIALGLPNQAFENYVLATDSTRSTVPQLALREHIATAYASQLRYDLAVEQYDAILAVAQNNGYRAGIEVLAAQAEINGSLPDRGYARLQAVLDIYPDTAGGYQAMILLLNAGYTVDNLKRAQISFANEDYGAAITAIEAYRAEVTQLSSDVLLILGQSHRAVGNYTEAMNTFQSIIDNYAGDPNVGEAWLDQGRTIYWSGDIVSAVNHYSQFATSNPNLPQAAEALWRVGYLYAYDLADSEQALSTFENLGNSYPGNEWSQDGLLIAATLALESSQLERAANIYTQLANTGSGENQALAFHWLGRLYLELGQDQVGRDLLGGAAQADPTSYYGLRANDILSGQEPFTPPISYRFEFDESAAIAEAEQWLRNTFGIQQEGALYPLSPTLENDLHMIRGRELWALAAFDDARAEFDSLREQVADDPLLMYQLAHYFAEIGLYRSSIEAAAVLITNSGFSTYDVPSYIARLRYPIHYADLVLPAAEQYGLDPLLVFSLIRQESLYQSFATSFAFAQGLMQIIPDTGYWVAEQLSWPNYENDDVYRPYINVAFGTYYLSWTLDYLDGVTYAALAGYNGGPGNAQRWLEFSGRDLDKFVQTIEFSESRLYVTRIYEQYHVYRHLYGVE